jgi:hypothetical protein|tara:strand:+ start:395 stop:640 length:246 start_codon:yes stop_codon:yes gene_type:complete
MTKKIHPREYMSNDYWKYNLDEPEYKRGSRHNKIGMWIMFIFYGIILVQVIHAMTVLPFFPITFSILLGLFFIVYVAWRAS